MIYIYIMPQGTAPSAPPSSSVLNVGVQVWTNEPLLHPSTKTALLTSSIPMVNQHPVVYMSS